MEDIEDRVNVKYKRLSEGGRPSCDNIEYIRDSEECQIESPSCDQFRNGKLQFDYPMRAKNSGLFKPKIIKSNLFKAFFVSLVIFGLAFNFYQIHSAKNSLKHDKESIQQIIKEHQLDSVTIAQKKIEEHLKLLNKFSEKRFLLTKKLGKEDFEIHPSESTFEQNSIYLKENSTRPQQLTQISTSGILIWKLTNFSSILKSAKNDGQVLYLSDPFYSSQFGYLMLLGLYPNGLDKGLDTHISIYFYIIQSEMDDILIWPFSHQVSISIMDQITGKNHLKKYFWPKKDNSAFGKPKGDFAIGWGWPMFISHEILQSNSSNAYLNDDTIYVKAVVEAI